MKKKKKKKKKIEEDSEKEKKNRRCAPNFSHKWKGQMAFPKQRHTPLLFEEEEKNEYKAPMRLIS
jgi:hypothetical protein